MPVTQEFWFARRFPLDNPRSAMAPVHWKGFAATGVFIAAMVGAAGAFLLLALSGAMIWGAIAFALSAAIAGLWFIAVAQAKGDKQRTVADYREGGTGV